MSKQLATLPHDSIIAKLDIARTALSEATTMQATKKIADVAAAAEIYARRQKLGEESICYAQELKLDAQRKLGEMLNNSPKNAGARGVGKSGVTQSNPTLSELGLSKKDSAEAQFLASLPEEDFESVKSGDSSVREEKRKRKRKERVTNIVDISLGNTDLKTDRKFPLIYADPPWRYEHVETESRAIENQYPTMSLDDICELPVDRIATDDCILFMWATSPKLGEAFQVLKAWGFEYRTCAVWDKQKIGMGYYFRQQHELLLVATRGALPTPLPANRPSSVFSFPRGAHSAKPHEVAELIEAMYPELPKVELFCRSPRAGWEVWGNQAKAA